MKQIMTRLEHGKGTQEDIETLLDVCDNILGRSFCALGDASTSPITSGIQHFREEFELGTHTPWWEAFPPENSALFPVTQKEAASV